MNFSSAPLELLDNTACLVTRFNNFFFFFFATDPCCVSIIMYCSISDISVLKKGFVYIF